MFTNCSQIIYIGLTILLHNIPCKKQRESFLQPPIRNKTPKKAIHNTILPQGKEKAPVTPQEFFHV